MADEPSWGTTQSSVFTTDQSLTISLPKYQCPKHGVITSVTSLWRDGKVVRHWCGECYVEMLDEHCCAAREIGKP